MDTVIPTSETAGMGALADLWKSERGLVTIVLILSMSVLTALGSFTGEQWIDYTKWIAVVYVGSKTVTGAVALAKGTSDTSPPVVAPVSPPTPTPVIIPAS